MELVISNNEYNKQSALYVLSDANSSEVIAIIKSGYQEDVEPRVLKALREHHDEEHTHVYNVQVFNSHNTKFDSDGDDGEGNETNDRNYNLIRTACY